MEWLCCSGEGLSRGRERWGGRESESVRERERERERESERGRERERERERDGYMVWCYSRVD